MKDYFVYILKCADDSYYTGITNNLKKRISEHQSGLIKGYISSRLPVKLVFSERFSDVNDAIRFEKQVKGWSRKKKEALINKDFDLLLKLSNKKKK
ncbi:MAG: GIY-YIG nuclease family protein [Ignavibacteriaceae bacterium]|jgi:putative endonuclease|nr:GIY-YIG nuclease family protein [Ignavibacteriaceae bacterium]MCW8813999.1 GIY-YIG nuclease family protein [Chlorobium sp.]MCW8823702.1 GIY-YIG nuclease family protein [Ignavibacteriaceae bacterium]MCW9096212.1 GIY-YIG nuclease family protein [Ignavibacteriaceae bacterium]